MATWAIGDVQGCGATLRALLARLGWRPGGDRLVLVGDLVNRGPDSLGVLRWAREQGDRVQAVLGNHDLHLLARAAGVAASRRGDTLDAVLAAPDRDELLHWLRHRPLLAHEDGHLFVHAGLHPRWSPEQAAALAREAEAALTSARGDELLAAVSRRSPPDWDDALRGTTRLATVIGLLTRLRTCQEDGRVCARYSGPPDGAPPGCLPWFDLPARASASTTVVFGHWAALGLLVQPRLIALDSGCVWGGTLSAVRLEDRTVVSVPRVDAVDLD